MDIYKSDLFLTSIERKIVRDLLHRIAKDGITSDLIKELYVSSKYFRDPYFLLTYLSLYLAHSGQIAKAIQQLLQLPPNAFRLAVIDYLKTYNTLYPIIGPYEKNEGFYIWGKTRFQQAQDRITVNAIKSYINKMLVFHGDRDLRILDIGTGDGRLIVELINQFALPNNIRKVVLCLMDQSQTMLSRAQYYVKKNLRINSDIKAICSDIRDLNINDLVQDIGGAFHFTNAATSIHHIPRTDKLSFLKSILAKSGVIFITELEGNHDIPGDFSPELIYSVYIFYGELLEDLVLSNIPEKKKIICRHIFLLAEALAILTKEYSERGNYHTTYPQWISIFNKLQCDVRTLIYNQVYDNSLKTMTFAVSLRDHNR